MRQRIIEALTYPRIVLLANLKEENCPQHLYFNAKHKKCRYCEQGEECLWLNCNDEFTVIAQRPMQSLYESLQFCISYVDAQCTRACHNVRRCPCESCEWIRSARRLVADYRRTM